MRHTRLLFFSPSVFETAFSPKDGLRDDQARKEDLFRFSPKIACDARLSCSPSSSSSSSSKGTHTEQLNSLAPSSLPARTMADPPKHFTEALRGLTDSQKALLTKLYCELGQQHLFTEETFNAGVAPALRRQLACQLEEIDQEYQDGGLEGYIKNARRLLKASKDGVNPLEGWKPNVPRGETFQLGTDEYTATEKKGMEHLGSCGFVLVAGGLGERLGYSGIKIGLPTEMTSKTCYIQLYIEYILAVQKKFAPPDRKLPLCIMTSGDTNEKTIQLLEKNNYFGMQKSQITIVQQGQGVPALNDNNAGMVFDPTSNYTRIQTKPHGHGDIHELLHKHSVAKKWKQMGIKWLVLFQDTNGLAFHTLPLMLGVSTNLGLIMNSLAVPRKAKEAIGAITELRNFKTGATRTVNVEYNQLDPMLRASGFKDGDVNDKKTGFSPYPGNINQLLFDLDAYVTVLERTKGLMPEFVNPKYSDEAKTVFKKPTRLECMMQDFPTVLEEEETRQVGFTSVPASLCFSPVKNATADGVKLQEKGSPPGTAATGEADQYGAHRQILKSMGCLIETAKKESFLGIWVNPGPAIVLKPDFGCCPGELEKKFPFPTAVNITARSTLFVRGSGVVIESLDLDGALIIDYKDGENVVIKDKVVKNDGWVRMRDENSSDEIVKMRGYRIVRKDAELLKAEESWCTIM